MDASHHVWEDIRHIVLEQLPPHLRLPIKTGGTAAQRKRDLQSWQRATCPILRQSVMEQLAALRNAELPRTQRPIVKANGVAMRKPIAYSRRQEFLAMVAVILLLYSHTTVQRPGFDLYKSNCTLRVTICANTAMTVDFDFMSEALATDVLRCQQTLRLFKEECESRNVKLDFLHGLTTRNIWGNLGLSLAAQGADAARSLLTNIFEGFAFLHDHHFITNYMERV